MAKFASRTTLYGKSQMEEDVFHASPFQAIDVLSRYSTTNELMSYV